MSTLRVNTLQDSVGTGYPAITVPGTVKAWVNLNGTGTIAIRESYGVTSLTDLATGRYSVNFTTTLGSANYCAVLGWSQGSTSVGGVDFENGNVAIYSRSASGVTVTAKDDGGAPTDHYDINVAVFL